MKTKNLKEASSMTTANMREAMPRSRCTAPHACKALIRLAAMLALAWSCPVHAEMGRTAGSWGVSPSGAATYAIPIWTPPGPKGVQPSLALTYDSQSGNGTVGVGWSLSGFSSIVRCASTVSEDGVDRAVNVDAQDRFCLNGNKLRITSGAPSSYGTAGAIYQTQIANFARVTSVGTAGTGPESFLVHSKDGLIYEYGNTPDSRVILSGSTVFRWLLNKVSDRDGNSYTVTYSIDNSVGRVPLSVQWAPTGAGASTYQYKATFVYTNKTLEKDIVYGRQNGISIPTKQRLDAVEIGYSASGSSYATKRQYRLTYQTSPTTSQSRLVEVKECAETTSTCLKPTVIAYQNGAAGVTSTASTGLTPAGGTLRGDFNGDGKSDVAYFNGSTWRVAFSNGGGFGTGVDTGITATPIAGRFLANQDGFLIDVSGTWRYVGFNGVSFTTTSTGTLVTSGAFLSDFNGDGLKDFVWKTVNGSTGSIMVQLNTASGAATVPSFGAAATALTVNLGPQSGNISFVSATYCPLDGKCDLNGDGGADLTVVVTTTLTCGGGPGGCTPTNTGYDLVTSGSGYVLRNAVANSVNPYLGLRFNDDLCTDTIRLGSTTLRVADCGSGTVAEVTIPAQPQVVMDWDGDGKTDLLVNNGGTFGVYRSRGSTASPFDALTSTTVPFSSDCNYYATDIDGDSLDELACALKVSPFTVSYYTHNGGGSAGVGGTSVYATQIPDLVNSITDGYGVAVSPAYVSTAQRNYTRGSGTTLPLVDATDAMIVVGKLTISDGIGGAYDLDYTYEGARRHGKLDASPTPGESPNDVIFGPTGQWAGFERIKVVDSRSSLMQRTSYEQLFPRVGMLKTIESFQSNQTSLISSATNTNLTHVLDPTANNQRYFNYVSQSSVDRYEVGGALNGQLITNSLTTFTYTNFTYGNLTGHTTVVTDKDSMSSPSYFNNTWTTAVTNTYASADVTNWCVGLLSETEVNYSSTAPGATSVTRTTGFTPDSASPAKCRIGVRTTEPSSTQYKVTETYGFDAFGNTDSISVVGRRPLGGGAFADMSPRATSINWGTTGQFPQTVTDASGAVTTFTYNFDTGTLQKVTDPNLIDTSFLYDPFNRRARVTQPDGTYTTWAYQDCSTSGCVYGTHRVNVVETAYDNLGGVISDRFSYLDAFERSLVTRSRLLNGTASWDGSYQWSEVQYDALGRVFKQYMPCSTSSATISCRNHATTFTYDDINRVTHASRPRSVLDVTPQTTIFNYAGRTQSVTDALGKTSSRIVNVNGTMRQTMDANDYAMNFTYDAAGSLTGVTDSLSNTRLSGVTVQYGAAAFQVAATDYALGAWTKTYNSLGELVAWTDAKGQSFSATYDSLSRPLTRIEPDTTTSWTWGSNSANFNIGRLQSVSSTSAGQTYSESYTYDNRTRLQGKTIVIPGDATYSYGYSYEPNKGWLDTLTYPTSTSSYNLSLRYGYQNGILQKISDANAPATVFWTANASNAWGQTTQETLGNGIVTNRSFDAVTSWLSSIQSGPGGNSTSVQNASYLYDLVGNLTQRQNNKLGLTETFVYGSGTDHLYRLSSSTLNSGAGATTNLSLTYDAAGNILTKNEPGIASAMIPHSATWTSYNYPSQITADSETATFSYGPDRQRWKMTFSSGGSPETTYYIGGLMEKVVVGATSTYRHTIVGGSGPVALYSRSSSGTNTLRYVLGDHQGSIDAIADSAGATLVNESFTAFGERRDATDWSGPPSNRATLDGITRQGYTYQTVLGSMGMNHMNGRVQDAVSGRFLSADPYNTEPMNTQNWSRYAYVQNNPLTFIDPSGFDDVRVDCSMERTPGGTVTVMNGSHVYPAEINVVCVVTPNQGGGGGGGGGSGGQGGGGNGGIWVPMPTLAPIDIYSSCDALADRMGEIQERREDLNALRDALQKADVNADVMEAILKGAQSLPLDVKLVGVSSPSAWVWLHPSAGYGQLLMPSHANGAFNAAIRTGATGAVRYMPLVSFGIDGAQVYSAYLDGDEMGMVYNTIDAAGTLALSRNVYGILVAASLKAMGGSKMIHENSRVVAAAQACEAESGVYVPY